MARAPGSDKRPRRTFVRSPQAVPWEKAAPVGCCHGSAKRRSCPRRPRARVCLRKGCGRKYLPRRWNQHYCQDPDCLREVRRWQAAKRQARRRQDEKVKAQHAETQRQRRKAQRQGAAAEPPPTPQPSQSPQPHRVAPARGHAARIFFPRVCATGQDASSRFAVRMVSGPAFAALTVVRRCAGFVIANVSGMCEALSEANRRASASMTPPANAAANPNTTALPRCQRPRRTRERWPLPRRSTLDCRAFRTP
jgi:hypothetical protein